MTEVVAVLEPVDGEVSNRVARVPDDIGATIAALIDAAPDAPKVPAPRAARRAPRSDTRVADEAAFVLHGYPYKETSLIVDALTRHHGRVALVARGAKRPRSALRGVLLAFQPLTLSWIQGRARAVGGQGSSDLRTLTRAEWVGGLRPLRGEALMSGFYLNELMQKLLARDDPHERLFDAYLQALGGLSDDLPPAPVLRRFEATLLREAGYGVQTSQTSDGDAIDPLGHYRYVPERGTMRLSGDDLSRIDTESVVLGKTLLDIDADDYTDPLTLAQSKRLMRSVLQHHLSGQVLQTRRLVLDLQSLDEGAAVGATP